MPLVRPTLVNDIKRLEVEFTYEYRPDALVFYVSICNELGEERSVCDEEKTNWGPHLIAVNSIFEAKLAANPHFLWLDVFKF
jgi:hypothetical protein